jgi:hypothetical protein
MQEPGAANMITYPRTLEGTVRKADDRRRLQREARAARKAQEAAQHAAEIKRLKSHKRREMDERWGTPAALRCRPSCCLLHPPATMHAADRPAHACLLGNTPPATMHAPDEALHACLPHAQGSKSGKQGQGPGFDGRVLRFRRLARIREVSGSAAAERMLAQVLGSADLDLDAYDQAMEAAFGDSYYQVGAPSTLLPCIAAVAACAGL